MSEAREALEAQEALKALGAELDRKEKRTVLIFEEFLEAVRQEPTRVLRNIFQLFRDMIKYNVPPGIDEYQGDPESIGFVKYDCSKIFSEDADIPFFADRLFANRFIRQTEALGQGAQQNRIYVYVGPPGCGKSTFLNNLLRKFEEYTETREGQSFEIVWELDTASLSKDTKADAPLPPKIEVPCPSHDHPILLIPKHYRVGFMDRLLSSCSEDGSSVSGMGEIRHIIGRDKEYEWVFQEEVCTVCKSLFWELFDRLGSIEQVLGMVKARSYKFDRRLGEGISVFNPGDRPLREFYLTDKQLQERLDQLFGTNRVRYVFSPHAKTNNGIYVLMDIKSYNKERLFELHNVVTEGVHKVDGLEERVGSLFFALMNPEDQKDIEKENAMESLQGRIKYENILYVLEVPTEVSIYRSIFGDDIDKHFLPRVLENFARVIISSRMEDKCKPLTDWIANIKGYAKYCDADGLLLRMAIYSGLIPSWLSEEDKKKFTAEVRRNIIAWGEKEGSKGFDGRDSIGLFSDFFSRYESKDKLITMANVVDFFKHKIGSASRDSKIPQGFIDSLVNWYDFVVLNEVKEALYFYNEEQITEDILHYLWSVNYETGGKTRCKYTGKEIEVTLAFLQMIGGYITGQQLSDVATKAKALEIQQRYVELLARDPATPIQKTELYQELYNSYVRNLKEKALQPFVDNTSFKEAVKAYNTKAFKTFDTRLKEHVTYMMERLQDKFNYTEQGAKEICLYVLESGLTKKFA